MKKKLIAISILTAISLSCSACGAKPDMAATGSEAVTAIAVNISTIEPLTIEQYVTVSSKVSSENEVSVIPKVSGTVKEVYVSLGDEVKAGDVLFEIDDTDARLSVQQAQASLNSAQAGLESAQANYEANVGGSMEVQIQQLESSVETYQIQYNDLLKTLEQYQQLYEAGSISKQTLDDMQSSVDKAKLQLDTTKNELELQKNQIAEETKKSSQATVNQSEASVAQAQVSLESAQQNLENTKVRAEIDGTIGSLNISKGSTVSTQTEAMTITSLDQIKVSFSVSEDVINRISTGSTVYVTLSAISDEPYETVISNISPTADSQTKLYTVEAYLPNDNHEIKPGMFASIRLVLDQKEDTISVPLNTVIETGGEKYVFVVDENNIAHKTIVETGIKNDESIEITSGLNMGDVVVTTGQDFLSDGSTVSISET